MSSAYPKSRGNREGDFIVLRVAAGMSPQQPVCYVVPAHTAYQGVYAKVFGPSSYDQCYTWAVWSFETVREDLES